MTRRLVLFVALFAFVLAPAGGAGAQSGAGTFEEAPTIKAGTFRDQVAAGEALFYGVDLKAGQRFSVVVDVGRRGKPVPVEVHLRVYNASRTEDIFAHEPALFTGPGPVRLRSASGTVGGSAPYPDPGTHYFSVSVEFAGERVAESYPLKVKVVLEDRPAPAPGEPAPAQPAPESEVPEEPSRTGAYALAFLGGLVAGFLIVTLWLALRGPARELRPL